MVTGDLKEKRKQMFAEMERKPSVNPVLQGSS
jgi:hypothetical protein